MRFSLEEVRPPLIEELSPLVKAHWLELGHYRDFEPDPNFDAYLNLQDVQMVRVFTARTEEGVCGYAVFFVRMHLHYREKIYANQDLFYLKPSHRGHGLGSAFVRFCDDMLAAEGVDVVMHSVKPSNHFGDLLKKHGYELLDHVYARRLTK